MKENHSAFTKPYVIVVSGSVGSGKSTNSAALSKALGDVPVLAFDHYEQYVEWPRDIAQWMNDGADPKHIRVPKLKEDLLALLDGKAITDPLTARIIAPSRYIILEEPSGRGRQEIREYVDWAAHINVPQDVCVTRVIERVMNMEVWNSKRTFQGESRKDLVRQLNAVASWMTQYQRARSMYIQVSQIAQENADLVVDGTKTIHEIVIDIMNSLNNKQGGLNLCE